MGLKIQVKREHRWGFLSIHLFIYVGRKGLTKRADEVLTSPDARFEHVNEEMRAVIQFHLCLGRFFFGRQKCSQRANDPEMWSWVVDQL